MSGGQWRELRPGLGPPIHGLIELAPVLDNGATRLATADLLRVTASVARWGYLARLRLRPGVLEPSRWTTPMAVRITAGVIQGRIGAFCVADDLATVLSSSAEWTEDDGEITLTVVVYTYPGQGWLVFRNTSPTSSEARFWVSSIEVFAMRADPPAVEVGREPGRIVVFTAITNGYDTLKPPAHPEADCDYVCFTDDPASIPAPWTAVPIERRFRNPRLDALWYRVHPHLTLPDHDVSVYLDGRFELRTDLAPLARAALSGTSLAVFDNPWHACLYLSAEDDVREGRDAAHTVQQQVGRYRRAGFPPHLACLLPGILMRRHHDPDVIRVMTAWWRDIESASFRDQLSFTYALWSQRLAFRRVWLPVHDNPYVKLGAHNYVDYYRTSSRQRYRGV